MRKSSLPFLLLLSGFIAWLVPLGCSQPKTPEAPARDASPRVQKPSPPEKAPAQPPHLALRQIVPDPDKSASGWVIGLAFSPDSEWLAIAKPSMVVVGHPDGGWVHLRRLTTKEERWVQTRQIATSLSVRRQDGLLAIGTGEKGKGAVLLLEPRAEKPTTLDEFNQIVQDVVFSADGKTLAILDSDRHVSFWDVAGRKETRRIYSVVSDPPLALSSDGKRLATTSGFLLDLTSGSEPKALTQNLGGNCVSFSPDGKQLAVGDGTPHQDGYVTMYDATTGEKKRELKSAKPDKWVRSIAFSPDGKILAVGYYLGVIKLFDLSTGKEILSHDAKDKEVRQERKDLRVELGVLRFSPDGKTLAAGFSNGRTVLWEPVLGP